MTNQTENKRYLFRGFHPYNNGSTTIMLKGKEIKGDWAYGSLFISDTKEYAITTGYLMATCSYTVIPETIGQWVMLDKDDKDVFDGDIVKDIDGRVYEIKFFDFEWIAEQTKSFWINIKHLKACEVISNKWEEEQ